MKSARIGVAVGSTSVAFSTLCFAITPAFTPALVLAIIFGSLCGAIALALKAKRTAIVAFAFALAPLFGFLLLEYVAERVRSGYVACAALGMAVVVAAFALINYSRAKRPVASTIA